MPPYTRGILRDQATAVAVNTFYYYGFLSRDMSALPGVNENDLSVLGHVFKENLDGSERVLWGANCPRPQRVRMRLVSKPTVGQQEFVSTFIDYRRVAEAIRQGWRLVHPGIAASLTNSPRTRTAVVELSNDILYAFPTNTADYELFAADLGWEDSTSIRTVAERDRIVLGTKVPKPARARRKLDNGSTVVRFVSTTSIGDAIQRGWSVFQNEVVI